MASAMAAVEGGAQRIELCSDLNVDGLTPPMAQISELRERFPALRIHVLIRPREGDFVYREDELRTMESDIRAAVEAGATAIVSGALTEDGDIDIAATRRLIAAAAGLPFTFHRAFDNVRDMEQALLTLHDLGTARVLTSGGAATAEAGISVLRRLVELEALTILPGGGVNSANAARILRETGATEIHGSCSRPLPDGQRRTSADEVREVLRALSSL